MKRYILLAVGAIAAALFILGCSSDRSTSAVTVEITDKNLKDVPVLYLVDGTEVAMELSPEGVGEAVVECPAGMYAKLGYKYTSRLLWLTPGSEVKVSFASDKFHNGITVEGTDGRINTFINGNKYKFATVDDCKLSESEFIALADSMLSLNLELLEKENFSKEFNRSEAIRLIYYTYQMFPSFRYFHTRIAKEPDYVESENYWAKLRELCLFEESRMMSEDYMQFVAEAVALLSKHDFPMQNGVKRLVSFIEANIKDEAVAEYLVNRRVCAYLKKNGLSGAEEYLEAFSKYVKDTTLVAGLHELKQKMGRCGEGAVSPDFKCTDITGKEYTLANFRGKYVYIDVWATWCGPCKKEAPHLARLEKEFEGQQVYFIGISCDKSREAWAEYVKNGSVAGIQLYLEPDSSFMSDYEISSIPRFILLDKEGRIISAKATAPSAPQTAETIAALLKK